MGNLTTPKRVQKLQTALHAKAKAEANYRFYALYDKISREDILAHAYAQCRSNKGAPGVDGQDFANIEAYGVERGCFRNCRPSYHRACARVAKVAYRACVACYKAFSLKALSLVRRTGTISMKFGIHNPSWVYGPDSAEAFEAVKAKAQWAENHGFVWFSVMDHLIQIGGVGAPDEPFMEGWTVLSALAAVTSRIRLATLATSVGYRNPAHLAKIAAGVDLISRGRLTLGIGAGYLEAEYRQYGWEFPARPAVRIRQMEEARPAYPRDVDRKANDLSRQIFPCRGRDPRAEAGAEATSASDDRWRWRAAHIACGRSPGRCLQCRRRSGYGEAQARGAPCPLRCRTA